MSVLLRPIPPLYTVYILRSSLRTASLYIGSTPNPPRRLKQHNGEVKGGAARTSRKDRRPWEIIGLVSGFPGMVAALKFEWALSNPHRSLHIPSTSRITVAKRRKRGGRPRRPPRTQASVVSNLHLLLRVPSFARWPLNLHFFDRTIYKAWEKVLDTSDEPIRRSVLVYTDFGPSSRANDDQSSEPWGIHALPLDHTPIKDYVAKTQSLYAFEREGNCVVCGEHLQPGKGLYATCPNTGCEGTGHISCWSRHLLGHNNTQDIIPVAGHCPKCKGEVLWGDMMKEVSLRVRGPEEVEKLLAKRRKRRARAESTESE
ncbi:hypothetical protein F5X99DRAFT_217108 [Biscogniauxia marginata]|nr:hypothetical protein F5X99DRAFT_217108 [Biscogniauxia marginata]